MRIGLIAPPWAAIPPVGYGGTEAVIDQLARGIQAAGHEVVLFTVADSACPVPSRHLLASPEGMRIGACVPELRHVLAAYDVMTDVDIIHDHTMAGPILAAVPGFTDLPVVTTNHGPFNDELNDLYRRISSRVALIAISNDQARRARDVRIAKVIHHGVDPAAFPVGAGDGGYLLFLGRMTAEKGAHRAIRIARGAGKRLVIAAKMREESERRYFETEIEPQLGDDVEFIGEVMGRHKLDLLGGAEALLNPIRWPEPFGMVMIEALACGTPVVSFPEGAAPEIVTTGTDGFLGDTEQDLIDATLRLRHIDRAACRATVLQRFSTAHMTRNHLDLYRAVIAGQAHHRRAPAPPSTDLVAIPPIDLARPSPAVKAARTR
ncbi:MAG: glycosyltransferase family 4 protein [Acidimicrobiales bacterium]